MTCSLHRPVQKKPTRFGFLFLTILAFFHSSCNNSHQIDYQFKHLNSKGINYQINFGDVKRKNYIEVSAISKSSNIFNHVGNRHLSVNTRPSDNHDNKKGVFVKDESSELKGQFQKIDPTTGLNSNLNCFNDLKDSIINNLLVNNLSAENFNCRQNDSLRLQVDSSSFDWLSVDPGTFMDSTFNPKRVQHFPSFDLFYNLYSDVTENHSLYRTKNIDIRFRTIDSIIVSNVDDFTLQMCEIKDLASAGGYADTVTLVNLKRVDSNANMSLHFFGDRKVVLQLIGTTGIKNMNFDYSYYVYDAGHNGASIFDEEYEETKKNFSEIIQAQKRQKLHNGLMDALLDSCIYEDHQHLVGSLFVPIKLWWNEYGYDKERVVVSSLELFLLVFVINFLMFGRIVEAYDVAGIKKRRTDSMAISNKGVRRARLVCLCLIYSGFIFFGLKLDFNKLSLLKIRIAFWIILQYAVGIVSLAYLANLIISK